MSRPRKRDKHLPAYVRIMHGSYQYRGKAISRVEDGEAALYEALSKAKAIGSLESVPAAVAAFKMDYLKNLAESTREGHSYWLDIFAEEFAEFRLDQVTAPHITRSIDNLYSGHPTSAKHYKSRISTFFRWCIAKKGLLKVNPCREVWVAKPIPKKTQWTDALFWAVHGKLSPMHQCYHELSFLLYQRTTDIRRLKRAQDRGSVIYFEPSKTARSSGAAVEVPVTPAIRSVLDRAAAISREWGIVCPYVIHTRQGAPYTQAGIHSAYRAAEKKLHGGKRVGLNPKSLLPYAVTKAKRAGATLEQLKVGRAHTNIATTEGYIQSHDVPVSEVRMELPPRPSFDHPPTVLITKSDD